MGGCWEGGIWRGAGGRGLRMVEAGWACVSLSVYLYYVFFRYDGLRQ